MNDGTPETVVPALVLAHPVETRDVLLRDFSGPIPPAVRVMIEREIFHPRNDHRLASTNIWRHTFLNTATQPPRAPTMPEQQAAQRVRQDRSIVAAHQAAFDTAAEALRQLGYEVTLTRSSGWPIILARPRDRPEDPVQVAAHVPYPLFEQLRLLWDSGFRIDGFAFEPQTMFLHTTVRTESQIDLVHSMLLWLDDFLAGVMTTRVPPAPYSFAAAASLGETITKFDSPIP